MFINQAVLEQSHSQSFTWCDLGSMAAERSDSHRGCMALKLKILPGPFRKRWLTSVFYDMLSFK